MHLALLIFAWLLALVWCYKLWEVALGLPTLPNLTLPEHNLTPVGLTRLTVIVPARNEAVSIAACVESLLAQDYPDLHIIAINDRSTDQTGSILDALARIHPTRLSTLHVVELPGNWLGKTNAMATAARQALAGETLPEFLLFTDADILFHPEVLRRALALAQSTRADHLVVLPTTIIKSRGEAMILSFFQVLGFWAVRLWRVADPDVRDAVGVGAFNLVRTSAYRQIGGFEAMRMEIVEDLALGRGIKRAGLRQRVAIAPGMVSVYWAAGLFGILKNMTKNLFAIVEFRSAVLLASSLALTILCISPAAFLVFSFTRVPAVLTFGAVAALYTLSSRVSGISAWYAALFPLSAALLIYSMLRSMLITLKDGGVTWRGTFYPLAQLRR